MLSSPASVVVACTLMLLASALLFLRAPTGGLAAHLKAAPLPVLLNKPPPSAEASRNALKDMLPVIEKLRHIGGTAGVSVGVLNHGEVVCELSLGFSDRDSQRIADPSTRYPLGSLSKAFVATTVSELVHEGLLEWDKPVTAYLPELHFAADPSLADGLTLVDLLSHQTGLERLDAFWLGAENEVLVAKDATVAVINQLSPASPLRTKWMYNNWMYALVGEVVERVTRSSWGTALQTRVLEPLQLQQTTVIKSRIPAGSTASPYIITDDGDPVRIADVPLLDGTTMSPAGGVRSSAHDMLIWAKSLMAGFRGAPSPLHRVEDVLSGYAFTNRSSGFDELYALGLAKVTTPTQFGKMGFNPSLVDQMPLIGADGPPTSIFYHNGAMPGYNHCLMISPASRQPSSCSQTPSPAATRPTGSPRPSSRRCWAAAAAAAAAASPWIWCPSPRALPSSGRRDMPPWWTRWRGSAPRAPRRPRRATWSARTGTRRGRCGWTCPRTPAS